MLIVNLGIQVSLLLLCVGVAGVIISFTNHLDRIEDIVKQILKEMKK